jgi:DNA topoisomerase-1
VEDFDRPSVLLELDPACAARIAAAKAAHLRYVSDRGPGYTRERVGNEFVYRDPEGSVIEDREKIARIKAIAIPPAWTKVWICAHHNGHIQATGRDARGRKQYRYHPHWRSVRDETKYEHTIVFGRAPGNPPASGFRSRQTRSAARKSTGGRGAVDGTNVSSHRQF